MIETPDAVRRSGFVGRRQTQNSVCRAERIIFSANIAVNFVRSGRRRMINIGGFVMDDITLPDLFNYRSRLANPPQLLGFGFDCLLSGDTDSI